MTIPFPATLTSRQHENDSTHLLAADLLRCKNFSYAIHSKNFAHAMDDAHKITSLRE